MIASEESDKSIFPGGKGAEVVFHRIAFYREVEKVG